MNTVQLSITAIHTFSCFGASAEDAEQIYKQPCVVCHADGAEGAPRPGVKAEWEPGAGLFSSLSRQ
jgi:cytochrome c5